MLYMYMMCKVKNVLAITYLKPQPVYAHNVAGSIYLYAPVCNLYSWLIQTVVVADRFDFTLVSCDILFW